MGRPDYDVGDLVVCVVDGPIACPCRARTIHTGDGCVGKGRVVRVGRLAPSVIKLGDHCGCFVVLNDDGQMLGAAFRFRKVNPLPDSLTSLLASKPIREQVTA